MNEGVKIVCDKILEHPEITDANSYNVDWTHRRWMSIADYIIENDFDTFDQEDVDAVKNAIREARQKYFTANVIDHVVWESDPQRDQLSGMPPLPKSQKVIAQERADAIEQDRRRQEKMKMEYEMKRASELRGQQSMGYAQPSGLLNSHNALGGIF